MIENDSNIALKERLILSGIDEILENGVESLSLRKIASSCGASCAAPYKHFKNKEDFLVAISDYVEEKWEHLRNQIISLYEERGERICELCIASIKFRLANTLYARGHFDFDSGIIDELKAFCRENQGKDYENLFFMITALVRGTETLIASEVFPNKRSTYEMLRTKLMAELNGR